MNYWDQILFIAWLIAANLTVLSICAITRNRMLSRRRPNLDELVAREREKLSENFMQVLSELK